jgi:hypothetical protein
LRARRVLRHGDGYTDPLLRRSQIGHSSFFDRERLLGSTHSVASPLRLLHQVHTRLLRSRATSKTSSRREIPPEKEVDVGAELFRLFEADRVEVPPAW